VSFSYPRLAKSKVFIRVQFQYDRILRWEGSSGITDAMGGFNYWASGKELAGDVFFEENSTKILLSLIAMAEAGMFMQGLI